MQVLGFNLNIKVIKKKAIDYVADGMKFGSLSVRDYRSFVDGYLSALKDLGLPVAEYVAVFDNESDRSCGDKTEV